MKRKDHGKISNVVNLIGQRCYSEIETIIQNRLQCSNPFMKRLELEYKLEGHDGCVNCLEWSDNGSILASASDDYHVMLWDPYRHRRIGDFPTQHRGNIFSVKFMPRTNNELIATGAADHRVYVFNINRPDVPIWKCQCHGNRVKRLATAPDTPHMLWSSSEDGVVMQFDLREKHECNGTDRCVLIRLKEHSGIMSEVKCIAINPRRPELLAVGACDTYARMYDRRKIKLVTLSCPVDYSTPHLPRKCVTYFCPGQFSKDKMRSHAFKAITYLTFSPDGTELLVNMGTEQIYLYDIKNAKQPVFLQLPHIEVPPKIDASDGADPVEPLNKQKLPDDVDKTKKIGNDYLENEKYLQAIYQYTLALKVCPNNPVLYLNRATAYMRRDWYGDVYAALRDCHSALKLDPSYLKAHFRMARALLELGHLDESAQCLDELRKRFPSHLNNTGVAMLSRDINVAMELKTKNGYSHSDTPTLSNSEVYWRTRAKDYKERFVGHCNTTTDIKEANFFGNDGNYIIAGSDDGNFFVWERPTNMITYVYKGDMTIVNCVQPHPYICLLATSGIDHEIRLWSPQPENKDAPNRIAFYDIAVQTNQHRMQADPIENDMCRLS